MDGSLIVYDGSALWLHGGFATTALTDKAVGICLQVGHVASLSWPQEIISFLDCREWMADRWLR
jgi:hypothetical protein